MLSGLNLYMYFLIIIHNSRKQTFNFHPNYISVMMCLERLNNGVRCRHNKHLALITESAVPYLATDQNSGHYSQPTVGPNVSKPAKNKIQKICEIHWSLLMTATVWQILNMNWMQWPETESFQICWNLLGKIHEIPSS